MSKVKWGILSTANIGVKRVIPAILAGQRGVIGAIASREAGRAAEIAVRFGIGRSYGSYQALLEDPDIEAVYNPLPNHLHVEWTVKALEAGKHVLCEKPIALNAADAETIVGARDRSGRQVIEAFMIRCHPQWQRTRELVGSGRIGTVRAIQSAFVFSVLDPNNVRNRGDIGGGALYDVGCYPIVTARYVFGCEPDRAIALIDRDPQLGVDRVTSGMLAFPGGGQLAFSSALQLAPYQRVVILGTAGRIELKVPFTPDKEHGCRLVIDSGKSLDGSSAVLEELAPFDQFAAQCDLAAAVFRGEAAQEFPIEDAIANMRVIDALYRSGASGRWETPLNRAATVGLIGTGHIAASLVTGWCAGDGGPDRIVVSPRNAEVARDLARAHPHVTIAADNQALLDASATVVLCVRPQVAAAVLEPLRFAADHRVLSVIATLDIKPLLSLIAPASAVARAVPLPFAAQRRGPLALHPAPDWAVALLRPLGDVIAAPGSAAFDRFCGATATMAAFFRLLGTLQDWLIAGQVPAGLAGRYVAGLAQALSTVPAAQGQQADGGAVDFALLSRRFATRGGINEQLLGQLDSAAAFALLPAALEQVLRRIEGHEALPPDPGAQ